MTENNVTPFNKLTYSPRKRNALLNKPVCPHCASNEITIDQYYDFNLRTNVWELHCRDCGYETQQFKPF